MVFSVGLRPIPYNFSVARLSRVLFSVAVEGLALRACTLCSLGRHKPPHCVLLGDEAADEVGDGDVGVDGLDAQVIDLPAQADVADGN